MKNKVKNVYKDWIIGRRDAYKTISSIEAGRKVIADIYEDCGINKPSFVSECPYKTAYNEGKKSVALHVKSVLKQSNEDVDKYMQQYSKDSTLSKGISKEDLTYNPLTHWSK
jgi:hypothetical protein